MKFFLLNGWWCEMEMFIHFHKLSLKILHIHQLLEHLNFKLKYNHLFWKKWRTCFTKLPALNISLECDDDVGDNDSKRCTKYPEVEWSYVSYSFVSMFRSDTIIRNDMIKPFNLTTKIIYQNWWSDNISIFKTKPM